MVIFTRRWTQRGHDMTFGPIWAMLLSVVQVVFFGRVPCTKETLSDFFKIMGPDKEDPVVWYRGVTSFQMVDGWSTPGFWGVTFSHISLSIYVCDFVIIYSIIL